MDPAPTNVSESILSYLRSLHAKYAAVREGEVATYIPELGKADPEWFGICLVTAGGSVYEVGETGQPFTIQSISKPFLYGRVLEECGLDRVLAKVGVEPTGDAFNSISLEPQTGRPRNPMINAGAIATLSLLPGGTREEKGATLLDVFSRYAGRRLDWDEAVYRSESATADRNRAIGYMLRSFGILGDDLQDVLELYFRQCSISVTCRDLGVMAATLANNGVNPLTGERALREEYVPNVLGVMASCGMYNSAGEWIYRVGLPAKSGVGGGVIAVLPGQLGIAVFSPRLDAHGNSVRGMRLCEELSRKQQLHLLSPPINDAAVIRGVLSGADFHSTRISLLQEFRLLAKEGDRIKILQLQGNLTFTSAEGVSRALLAHSGEGSFVVLDCRRLTGINRSACGVLRATIRDALGLGAGVVLSHARNDSTSVLVHFIETHPEGGLGPLFAVAESNDAALEWCENHLLAALRRAEAVRASNIPVPRRYYSLFLGMTEEELEALEALMERRTALAGTVLLSAGKEAQEVFFLAQGSLSVLLPHDPPRRIASISPGSAFGELAISGSAVRSASVVADAACVYDALSLVKLDHLTQARPSIRIKLLHNLSLQLVAKLRHANRQLNALEDLLA